jgi:hypothetical protein
MAITNPFSITYGSRQVGGSTGYQLHGPYVIDKSFSTLRLVFDVVITSASFAALKSAAESLEDDFRKRDQNLVINLDGSSWTYTHGTNLLNSTASISKSGDRELDRGYSRAYTCVVEAELPADDNAGLRDLEVNVDYEAGRQKIVTFQGVYTPSGGNDASAQYLADFDTEATTILSAIDGSATWEMVDENYTRDRNDHTCNFQRQYVELLADQAQGSRDHANIRDHRMVFTDTSQHPGDSKESIFRLRRVVGTYDCAVDIEQTTDLQQVWNNTVKDHVRQLFVTNFSPQVFCWEDVRIGYDETSKRLSASIQFLYQKDGGEDVVEVAQSLAYRESRTIDYTPVHEQDEHAAYADPGWATLERIATRTVVVIGEEQPKRRIGVEAEDGPAGAIEGIEAGPDVVQDGWNIVQNTSQVSARWVGDPSEEQIQLSVLTETVVERFNKAPNPGRPLTRGGASPGSR